jgi:hypothetical protein
LVITPITMVYDAYNYRVNGGSKSTYNWGATLYNIIFCVHTHISPANFDVASLFYPLVTSLESKLVTNFLSHPRLTGLREVDVP